MSSTNNDQLFTMDLSPDPIRIIKWLRAVYAEGKEELAVQIFKAGWATTPEITIKRILAKENDVEDQLVRAGMAYIVEEKPANTQPSGPPLTRRDK